MGASEVVKPQFGKSELRRASGEYLGDIAGIARADEIKTFSISRRSWENQRAFRQFDERQIHICTISNPRRYAQVSLALNGQERGEPVINGDSAMTAAGLRFLEPPTVRLGLLQ